MYETAGLITGVRPSAALAETLRRSAGLARQHAHCYITPEHLLLALTGDPDAGAALRSVNADIRALQAAAASIVAHQLASLQTAGPYELRPHPNLQRLLHAASRNAARSPTGEIDGVIVIAALAGERNCAAAGVLQRHGLGAQQAETLLHGRRSPAAPATPQPHLHAAVLSAIIVSEEESQMVAQIERRLNGGAGSSAAPRRRSELQERLRRVRPSDADFLPPEPADSDPPAPPVKRATGTAPAGLLKSFPRRLRRGVAQTVDLHISREEMAALLDENGAGMSVTCAVSVILHAGAGGIAVETLAPQTQWLFDRPSFIETERFGRWRWRLTPVDAGRHKLQLIISCRNLDQHGVIGDVVLPNQFVDIRVKRSFLRGVKTLLFWLALMAAGAGVFAAALKLAPGLLRWLH
jgi:hypothetical protein